MPGACAQPFVDNSVEPRVRGFLHLPDKPNCNGVVLTHGAGGNAQGSLLVALAETFCSAGFTVLRCDLPFRQMRSWGPPGPGDAVHDRAGLKNAVAALGRVSKDAQGEKQPPLFAKSAGSGGPKIFLGGHSYGGRQASMLCAEEPQIASGLLLLSYPLHPPRRPEQQRTQHLPNLHTPALFVHGTRDPFGSIEELQQAVKMIAGKTKMLVVEGMGHDLGFKGKTRREKLPDEVLREFSNFFALSA